MRSTSKGSQHQKAENHALDKPYVLLSLVFLVSKM